MKIRLVTVSYGEKSTSVSYMDISYKLILGVVDSMPFNAEFNAKYNPILLCISFQPAKVLLMFYKI